MQRYLSRFRLVSTCTHGTCNTYKLSSTTSAFIITTSKENHTPNHAFTSLGLSLALLCLLSLCAFVALCPFPCPVCVTMRTCVCHYAYMCVFASAYFSKQRLLPPIRSLTPSTVSLTVPMAVDCYCVPHSRFFNLYPIPSFFLLFGVRLQLHDAFEAGEVAEYSAMAASDVASVLKSYLRALPEPLLMRHLYAAWADVPGKREW